MEILGALHHHFAFEGAAAPIGYQPYHPDRPESSSGHGQDAVSRAIGKNDTLSSGSLATLWLLGALVTSTLQGPVLLQAVLGWPIFASLQHWSTVGQPSAPTASANVVTMEMSELMKLLNDETTSVSGSLSTDDDPLDEASVTINVVDDEVGVVVTSDRASSVPSRVVTANTCVQCLRLGNQGAEVTYVQNRLKALGFFTATSTGYFGPITESAVVRFQQANALMVDGVVGPQSLSVLAGEPAVAAPVVTAPVVTPTVVYYDVPDVAVPTVRVSTPVTSRPPSTVTPGTVGTELYKGSTGATVRQLQNQLKQLGFYQGPVTGYYGLLTAAAVEDFQRSNGIPATGITGTKTLLTIRERVNQ